MLNVVTDFGADPTGTKLCDTAFDAVKAAAQKGETIFFPAGTYTYANTLGPFEPGVSLKGEGGGQDYKKQWANTGTILNYTGLADAVRLTTSADVNVPQYMRMQGFLVNCTNPLNRAPTRLLASQNVGGGIVSAVAIGTQIQITTMTTHGLLEGQLVYVAEVTGTVEANGGWTATAVTATSFTLTGSTYIHPYASGGIVSYVCGAGVAIVAGINIILEDICTNGFATGIVLDGAENIYIKQCFTFGPSVSYGGDVKRMSAGIWLTDSAWGCRGMTAGIATNTIYVENCVFSGCRIGIWCQGGVSQSVSHCQNQTRQADPDGIPIYVTSVVDDGKGRIKITTDRPHRIDWHAFGPDQLYVGVNDVKGCAEANGEWIAEIIDETTFTIVNTVARDGAIGPPPNFVNAYTQGGRVHPQSTAAFALIGECGNLKFDTCYSEGAGHAHFLFSSPQADVSLAFQVSLHNCFTSGGDSPFIWIDSKATPYTADANHNFTLSHLSLISNRFASTTAIGAVSIGGSYVSLGNYYYHPAAMWDGEFSATKVLISDAAVNSPTDPDNCAQGVGGNPTAQWDIFLQSNTTSALRVRDGIAPTNFFDLWVHKAGHQELQRNIQSPGYGNRSGVTEPLLSARIAAGAPLAVIVTTEPLPPKSTMLVAGVIVVNRDDLSPGAVWAFEGVAFSVPGSPAQWFAGPPLVRPVGGALTDYAAPVISLSPTGGVTLSAAGNTTQDSTWTLRVDVTTSQSAR